MTTRERIQTDLADWLGTWASAPYGVLTGFQTVAVGRGTARTITFGISRYLDAHLVVWSAKDLRLTYRDGFVEKHERFDSVEAFKDFCARQKWVKQ